MENEDMKIDELITLDTVTLGTGIKECHNIRSFKSIVAGNGAVGKSNILLSSTITPDEMTYDRIKSRAHSITDICTKVESFKKCDDTQSFKNIIIGEGKCNQLLSIKITPDDIEVTEDEEPIVNKVKPGSIKEIFDIIELLTEDDTIVIDENLIKQFSMKDVFALIILEPLTKCAIKLDVSYTRVSKKEYESEIALDYTVPNNDEVVILLYFFKCKNYASVYYGCELVFANNKRLVPCADARRYERLLNKFGIQNVCDILDIIQFLGLDKPEIATNAMRKYISSIST